MRSFKHTRNKEDEAFYSDENTKKLTYLSSNLLN